MAVKKHELVADNRNQLDLTALAQYFQMMNEQANYLPPPQELVKHCQDIVKCLARTTGTEEQLWQLLQPVERFLLRVVTTVHGDVRHEVFTAILDKFYSYISDPQSDACPATAAVLVVIDESDDEGALSAARWLVQQRENGPAGAGLRAALSCLFRWLLHWHGTPALGNWIVAYIKALEENEQYDILIQTSLDNVAKLISSMTNPAPLHQKSADVIFHVLSSLRESAEAFDRISTEIPDVLVSLASDSGQWSRQLLQTLVDILTSMVDGILETLKGDAQDVFRDKYADVILCLERHMATRGCGHLQLTPWRTRNVCVSDTPHVPMRKVGLLNLGNTCYMNSVMQALLVTRQFSTHVMLKMTAVPYWAKMSILFSKMMHSVSTKLNPDEFFSVVKPPFFTMDNQHDSSEFLGYLFELLQSYEHCSDKNFDYTRPAVLNGASRLRMLHPHGQTHTSQSSDERPGTSQSRRSLSPRPGSSAAGSSSGSSQSLKRSSADNQNPTQKKRLRLSEATFLRRDSFIDSMFGGVLLTRVECSVCHATFLSRDVFRDLQLAFPEKTEGCQHSVQSLLEFYCSKERMSGDNQYECRDCGRLRDAERSVLIETTPKYLILVLKNFKFDSKLQTQTKLMHTVYHNHTVTLPTVRTQPVHPVYNLFAAVIHAGTTLDSGHYFTLAKDNDQWHKFNDDEVSFADENLLNGLSRSSTPYILFYRRTDVEEGAVPTLEELPPKLQESVLSHNKNYVETVRQIRHNRP
ncbi:Ubiquitin specific protease [Danaus plexippus plexippus]|uniref:Ubiquitin specific protease n=1 Tax=Danaus plexippus plexippus TaxID=278856 RepID=A0A212F9Q7_DANPL|nr:ubiquitin carboxyl-terminal hydrolase 35 [Danaus plexippus plexippus]OWR50453.1 Ubiquitin specific protease [Danaus plexippus plexippus]